MNSRDTDRCTAEAETSFVDICEIPELLEGILSHLPVLNLVRATGVSKTFRNVIQTSPQLQHQLFLLPTKDKTEYWQLVYHKDESNQLYSTSSPGIAGDAAIRVHRDDVAPDTIDWSRPTHPLSVIAVCPLLKHHVTRRAFFEESPPSTVLRFQERSLSAIEHWTHTFITSPMPYNMVTASPGWDVEINGRIEVRVVCFVDDGHDHVVNCEEGLTLASLVDQVFKHKCTMRIFTRRPIAVGEDRWSVRKANDTTMYDEIAICKRDYGDMAMRLGANSLIYLDSVVVPTGDEHRAMAGQGRVSSSISFSF